MPVAWIPSLMQKLTGGQQQIPVEGETVRQIVEALEALYPGFKARIVENDRIRTEIAVAVDGEVVTSGLRARVGAESEVHFLPALAGG
ncbi:MAG TPA: molybdopterin synthase sulfur carrier subunit [Candidatus Latescibacteria bacterium]|nr:molybdopterin synthase sulfur carrier subunit [Candidatus Handelsmanbacteria bacterium]HIL12001.1 molybdopterin synthase sulfur carrier subunit [Candidatus Latescibacterota bacterium]